MPKITGFVGFLTVLILSCVCAAIWSCSSPNEKSNKSESIVKVRLGAVLPLTGDAAQWGVPPEKGARLAAHEINITRDNIKVDIIFEDSMCKPARGLSAFKKLTSLEGVKVVIGAVCSSVTLALAPVANKNEVVLISPASTSPMITHAGDFIFRVVPSDDLRGRVFAQYLYKKGYRKLAYLYVNNSGGVGNLESFKKTFEALGGTVPIEMAYAQGTRDLRAQITKLKNSEVEGVVAASYPDDTILIIKQSAELRFNKPFFFQTEAIEDPNVIKQTGQAANGAIYIIAAPPNGEAAQKFVKKYEEYFGEKPELYAAEAYDIVHLVINAIRAFEDKVDSKQIRDYLYNVKSYNGASGMISFDKNGDVIKPMAIKQIKDGSPTLLEIIKP